MKVAFAREYFNVTGIKIGKSTINNKLRKELEFHYLRTTLKKNSTIQESGKLSNFSFIKAFTRSLKLGFIPIFLDKSKIELQNNQKKIWRLAHENLCYGNSSKDKINLLLAVGKDRVYASKIIKENTNTSIFIEFLEILFKELLIMDNLSILKTDEVINFY